MADEDYMGEQLILIDVRECPTCKGFFEESGEQGLIPHNLQEHPGSNLSLEVLQLLLANGEEF